MTVTPDRQRKFYISEPWLATEFCLLVRADRPYSRIQDLTTGTIGFADRPVDAWQLDRHLPNARRLSRTERSEVMEDMCLGRSDAAFMNAFAGISALLSKPGACETQELRWIAAPEIRSTLGIASTFEFRSVADALRDEISAIAADGKLAPILGDSGFASQQLQSIEALLNAKRRGRWLTAAAILFAALFLVALLQSLRIVRGRNRTREAERVTRETEHKLSLMASNMKEMVLAYDMNRRITFANPAVETLTGYTLAEIESAGFVNWIHKDDQARMLGYWEALFRGESFENEEYRLITRDGQTKWSSATWGPLLDDQGRQIGVQGSERDITDRKLADEELRESENRFRSLLELVQLPAAIMDTRGYLLFVNDYVLKITGWKREEVVGSHGAAFVVPDQRSLFSKMVESVERTGEPLHWSSEPTLITRDGKHRHLEVNNVVLRDSSGKVTAIASLGTDVTEHRALQEQYVQSQKLESLGKLAGGVAHDFNNLLTVINGFSDMVARAIGPDHAVRAKIDQIRQAGGRAAELTQQLLAFGRKQISEPRPVGLNRILDESGAMFRTLLGEDIELALKPEASLSPVMADPGQLHRVLMNLLANSRDAMPQGGTVTIETRNVDTSMEFHPERPGSSRGPFVLLSVADTGAGIDEKTRAHLFEPFFTTKEPGKGTGLGLSTVYGIVRQNDGWVEVTSEVGLGTTFLIYLPAIPGVPVTAPEGVAAGLENAGGGTILVVEDQEDVRQLTSAILESCGYQVLSAGDGTEALRLAAEHPAPIDLLLTDVVLPGINGKQVAEQVKRLRPGIEVLFTSGYPREVITDRGVLDHGVAYIAKPYTPEALAAQVHEALRRELVSG